MTYIKSVHIDKLRDEAGNVTQQGTTVTAAKLNNMEEGIETAHERLDGIETDLSAAGAAIALVLPKATNSAGTDAYVLTIPGVTAYTDSMMVLMRTSVANTGAATLNINGLGAKPIRTFKAGVDADISTGEIPANSHVLLCYSTTAVAGSGGFVSLNIRDADLLDGQHGSYYLAASSYTAADVLSKLLGVDGTGSGLDADKIDGFHLRNTNGYFEYSIDGTTWNLMILKNSQTFTANGTFTVPAGVTKIYVTATAAGDNGGNGGNGGPIAATAASGSNTAGAGGGAGGTTVGSNFSGGGGGGGAGGAAGASVEDLAIDVTPGQTISVTVGTGNTVFGSFFTLLKGGGEKGGNGGGGGSKETSPGALSGGGGSLYNYTFGANGTGTTSTGGLGGSPGTGSSLAGPLSGIGGNGGPNNATVGQPGSPGGAGIAFGCGGGGGGGGGGTGNGNYGCGGGGGGAGGSSIFAAGTRAPGGNGGTGGGYTAGSAAFGAGGTGGAGAPGCLVARW